MVEGQPSGSSGPPILSAEWRGTVVLQWLDRGRVNELLTARGRLSIPERAALFFAGTAIATGPGLSPKEHAPWLIWVVAVEGSLTLVAIIAWLVLRRRRTRALTSLETNLIEYVLKLGDKSPTFREGPAPAVISVEPVAGSGASVEEPPTRREGPEPPIQREL